MVNPVTGPSQGFQAYSYQQATGPGFEQPRAGENRIEDRASPAGDSQRGDQRELASRDEPQIGKAAANDSGSGNRGSTLDIQV